MWWAQVRSVVALMAASGSRMAAPLAMLVAAVNALRIDGGRLTLPESAADSTRLLEGG